MTSEIDGSGGVAAAIAPSGSRNGLGRLALARAQVLLDGFSLVRSVDAALDKLRKLSNHLFRRDDTFGQCVQRFLLFHRYRSAEALDPPTTAFVSGPVGDREVRAWRNP